MAKVIPTAWQDLDLMRLGNNADKSPLVKVSIPNDVDDSSGCESKLKTVSKLEIQDCSVANTPRVKGQDFKDALDVIEHTSPRRSARLAPIGGKLQAVDSSRHSGYSSDCSKFDALLSKRDEYPAMQMSSSSRHSESPVDMLFNYISNNTKDLSSGKASSWSEFGLLTYSVYNSLGNDKLSAMMKKFLSGFGYSTTFGWPHDSHKHVAAMFQCLANMYLLNTVPDNNEHDYRDDILNIESLTFCPNSLFTMEAIIESEPLEPQSETLTAAMLLADISGFSKYAGKMCLQGARGLDTLHNVTNEFLGLFVDAVYKFHGDVVSFAGDALLCVFPVGLYRSNVNVNRLTPIESLDQACEMAMQCAYYLKNNKLHSLSAHFAVSCGPIQFGMLGGLNNEWTYIMNGRCINEISELIDVAKAQQVVCTEACYENAIRSGNTSISREQNLSARNGVLIVTVTRINAPVFEKLNSKTDVVRELLILDDVPLLNSFVEKAELFIPKPVLNALSSGSLTNISELRRVVTLFLKLDSYSPVENANVLSLQPFFALFQEILHQSGGFLRQFLIDDKGCVAIAMWGVPSYTHHNDCLRGLFCSWNLINRIHEVNHRCSIGLSTGYAYCGLIGSSIRRDYACVGDKVNMAARLMMKANGKVLIDPDIYASVGNEGRKNLEKSESVALKGVSMPVTPYTFTSAAKFTTLRAAEEDEVQSILRKDVIQKLLNVIDSVTNVDGTQFLSRLGHVQNSDLNSAILVGDEQSIRNMHVSGKMKTDVGTVPKVLEESPSDPPVESPTPKNESTPRRKSSFWGSFGRGDGSKQSSFRFSSFRLSMTFESSKFDVSFSSRAGGRSEGNSSRPAAIAECELKTSSHDLLRGSSDKNEENLSNAIVGQHSNNSPSDLSIAYQREHCKIIIVSGTAGTGKSACAKFFRKSCQRRNIPIYSVHCRTDDEMIPYAAVQKIFWELAGSDKYRSPLQRKQLIAGLMLTVGEDFASGSRDQLLEYVSDLLVDDTDVRRKLAALYNKGKVNDGDDDELRSRTGSIDIPSVDNFGMTNFSRMNSEDGDNHNNGGTLSRIVSEDIKGAIAVTNSHGFGRRISGSGQVGNRQRTSSNDENDDYKSDSEDQKVVIARKLSNPFDDNKFVKRRTSEELNYPRRTSNSNDDSKALSGFGRKLSSGATETATGFARKGSNSLIPKASGDPVGETSDAFAAQNHQVECALESFLSNDVQTDNALESLFFQQDHDFSPHDVNLALVGLIKELLRPTGHTALILEDAHYCDELTWAVISQLQKADLNLIILMSVVTATNLSNENEQSIMSPGTAIPTQSEDPDTAREDTTETDNFDQKFGQTFQNSSSYSLINSCSATCIIKLNELGEKEVGDVLRHVVGNSTSLPAHLAKKVLDITSGNVFWVKQVAKYIMDNGFNNFLETVDQGNALQALQKLIICRFEKLSPEQQIVVKYASVIGQEFTIRTLAAVLPSSAISKLKQSILALKDIGIIYGVEDKSLALFGFHNALTRNTICSLVPPSEISEIHLKAARYIETQFAGNLRLYYHSLSYHYSFTTGHRKNAFKYTMKAADQAISRGSFRFGFNLLSRAHSISRTIEEYEIVEKVLVQGLQDIIRFKSKTPKAPATANSSQSPGTRRGSFTRQNTSSEVAANELQLIEDFTKLKEAVHNSIEPPITVNVHGSESGQKQTLQLKPMIYNAPLFSLKEVSERDFFGALRMLSFRSNRSIKEGEQQANAGNNSVPVTEESGQPLISAKNPLKLQLSYTENMSKGFLPKSSKTSKRAMNLDGNIEEGVEAEEESASGVPRTPRQQPLLKKLQSRIRIYILIPIVKSYPISLGNNVIHSGMRFMGRMMCGANSPIDVDPNAGHKPVKIPVRRRFSMSGT